MIYCRRLHSPSPSSRVCIRISFIFQHFFTACLNLDKLRATWEVISNPFNYIIMAVRMFRLPIKRMQSVIGCFFHKKQIKSRWKQIFESRIIIQRVVKVKLLMRRLRDFHGNSDFVLSIKQMKLKNRNERRWSTSEWMMKSQLVPSKWLSCLNARDVSWDHSLNSNYDF